METCVVKLKRVKVLPFVCRKVLYAIVFCGVDQVYMVKEITSTALK